ncbi:MAG TPA: helix-turn-helix transcriptional regulator [Thermoanaerobaculia bacterium]|nr:helix-turn-helix transcriptional regulator [Thermoanaerobaculia bacterium]
MPRARVAQPDAVRFGALVRNLRLQHGWTMAEFARRSHMTANYLSALEQGLYLPSLTAIINLAGVLGVDPGDLVRHVAAGRKQPTRAVLPPLPE